MQVPVKASRKIKANGPAVFTEASERVKHSLHIGFEDFPNAREPEDFINNEYLRVSDKIHWTFLNYTVKK